jgi:hypothetical protein
MSDTPKPVYTLLLTGTTKIQNVLTVEGTAMKPYPFFWDAKIGRYAFRTSSEKELNDLLSNAGMTEFHAFNLLLPDPAAFVPEPVAITPPPLPFKDAADAKALSRGQLVSILNGSGLYAGPKEATDKLARIVEGVFTGYALAAAGDKLVIPDASTVLASPSAEPAPAQEAPPANDPDQP